jgi:hypothetical protein
MFLMTKKREEKIIKEECFDISFSFIQWLNKRLKVYKEDAEKYIDLEYHRIMYKDQEYTQKALINKMIELSDKLLDEEWYYNLGTEVDDTVNELLDIFKTTFHYLWW